MALKKKTARRKATGKKAVKQTARKAATYKLCQKCFRENPLRAVRCAHCGSKRFAPDFIKKIEKVTGNTYAQVTLPQDSEEKRITLYKWWPGGNSSFNINTMEQWERMAEVIQTKLLPFLGWETKEGIVKGFISHEKTSDKQIKKLARGYPELIRKVLRQIDETTWEESTYEDMAEILKEISELLSKTDSGFRQAFLEVVQHLPKQGRRAVEDLSQLLQSWSLKQITAISHQVIDRIQTLQLFKDRVLDDKTYEIRGNDSIHRILETAMWIIDERYWLLHSNETLRKIVGDEIVRANKGNESKRPDFVCGTVGDKLIIVELKRPKHSLGIEDMNQLENYLAIMEQKFTAKSFECYLIGKTISDDLKKKMKYRGSQFKVRTFADLIDDTEKRYTDYLNKMKDR